MDFTQIKISLIDKIGEYHPAANAGTKRGWSHYVGGMADTGNWDKWKMLKEASIEQLEQCLAELEEEFKPGPEPEYSEEDIKDMNTLIPLPGGGVSNKYNARKLKEWHQKLENQMLWGK